MKKLIPSVVALLLLGIFILGWLDTEGFCASFFREICMFELSAANVLIPFIFSFCAVFFLYRIYNDSPKKCANLKPFFFLLFFTPAISVIIIIIWSLIGVSEDLDSEPSKLEFLFAFVSAFIYFLLFIPLGRHIWSRGSLVHYPYFGKGV